MKFNANARYIVTANRLDDGEAVWLASSGRWVERIEEAASYKGEDAYEAATWASAVEVVGAYPVEIGADGYPAGVERFRETIRSRGPTVRLDLGKQADAA
jgi:hypothetical protein